MSTKLKTIEKAPVRRAKAVAPKAPVQTKAEPQFQLIEATLPVEIEPEAPIVAEIPLRPKLSVGVPQKDFMVSFRDSLLSFKAGKKFHPDLLLEDYLMSNKMPIHWETVE